MNNPLISIIIPVYNVEKYLRQCLDSVLAQTYKDWECLLVDDGSKDSSGTICDEYAAKDPRFKVFHKENGGVGSARNLGLDHTKGEWVYFCDSDDEVAPDALRTFTDKMSPEIYFIMGGYQTKDEAGNIIRPCAKPIEKVISRDDALSEMYKPSDFSYQGYLWCKLMKSQVIKDHNMHFDEKISFNEDRLFLVEYLSHISNQVAYTTHCVYTYIERAFGAMGSLKVRYNKKFSTDFDAYVKMKGIVFGCTQNAELRQLAVSGIVASYKWNHNLMVQFNDYDAPIHKHMIKEMRRTGACTLYIKGVIRNFVRELLLLVSPKLLVKYHK